MTKDQVSFIVEKGISERLDKYLTEKLSDFSRSQIQQFIRDGFVMLNHDVVTKSGTALHPDDLLEIRLVHPEKTGLALEPMDLDILFEDEDVIVINKPAGLVVHPGAGNESGTLVNAVLAHDPSIRKVGEEDRPGIVHRLDKETSGVILIAKTDSAYRWIVKQFKKRDIEKRYLALVDGHPPTPTGRIEAPIIRDSSIRTRMAVGLRGQGKPSVSEYFELQRFAKHSLLEVHPITGRTHQIRVHLSYIGVPVAADTTYGRRTPSLDLDRFFLHAKSIAIRLPGARAPRTFEAPLPDELQQVMSSLEKV